MATFEGLVDQLRESEMSHRQLYWCCGIVNELWPLFEQDLLDIQTQANQFGGGFLEYQRFIVYNLIGRGYWGPYTKSRYMTEFMERYLVDETDAGYIEPVVRYLTSTSIYPELQTQAVYKYTSLVPMFVRPEYVAAYVAGDLQVRKMLRRRLSPASRLSGNNLLSLFMFDRVWESEFFSRPHTNHAWQNMLGLQHDLVHEGHGCTKLWMTAAHNWLDSINSDYCWRDSSHYSKRLIEWRNKLMPDAGCKQRMMAILEEFRSARVLLKEIAKSIGVEMH